MNRMIPLVCLLVTISLTGCGGGPGNAPPPASAKVSGTVKLNGSPMKGGEVRFNVEGQPPKTFEVKEGAFSGDAFIGQTKVDVVLEKEGPPNPTDPTVKTKVNTIAPAFWGPNTKLKVEVTASGPNEFKFEVRSK